MEGSILIGVQDPYKKMSYVAGKISVPDEKKPAKSKPADPPPLPNPSIWTELGQGFSDLGSGLKKAGNDFLDNGINCSPPSTNKNRTITNDAGVTIPVKPIEQQLADDAGIVVTDPVIGVTFATPDAGVDSLPATDTQPAADTTTIVKTDTAPVQVPTPEPDAGEIDPDGGLLPIPTPDTAPASPAPDAIVDPPVEIPKNIPIQITGDRIQSGNLQPISVILIGAGLKKLNNLYLHVAANSKLIDPKLPCVPGVVPVATRADGSYKFNPNDDGNRLPVTYAGYNLKDNTGKTVQPAGDAGAGALTGGTGEEVPANCSGVVQPTDIKILIPQSFYTTSDPAKKGTDGVLDATLNLSMPIDASNYGSYGGKFDYRIEVRAKSNE